MDLFVFQPGNKQTIFFVFSSFSETLGKTSTSWARSPTCQKKEKLQMRSELRKQLSSCLLDPVVVHIFFNLLDKYRMIFTGSPRKVRETYLCQLLHTSTSAGLVLVLLLVKLAKSSQSSHSSPWVEKDLSTIGVFHLNRSIAKDASQDGRGEES